MFSDSIGLNTERFTRKIELKTINITDIHNFDSILISSLKPDLILLMIGFVGIDGLDLIRYIRSVDKQTPILGICSRYISTQLDDLMNVDIQGIITTSSGISELEATIYAVLDDKGKTFIPQFERIKHSLVNNGTFFGLDERQEKILFYLGHDLTNKEISEKLNISSKTVDGELHKIYQKLQVKSAKGAIGLSFIKGIISY